MRHPFACPEHRTSGPSRCRSSRIAIARLAVGGARTPVLSFSPTQQLADDGTSAPRQLLCEEAGASPLRSWSSSTGGVSRACVETLAMFAPRGVTPAGPVLVPFGAAANDWAAVQCRPVENWSSSALGSRTLKMLCSGAQVPPRAGARQARRKPPALARRARGSAGPGHLGRAAPDPGGCGGRTGSEPRRCLVVVACLLGAEKAWPARLKLERRLSADAARRRGLRRAARAPAALTRFTWSIRPVSRTHSAQAGP